MSNAICTGLASSGNSFSEANRLTFMSLPSVIFSMASSPLEEDVLAVGPGARLVGLDRDERRRVAVVDLQVAALGDGPDALVAVGGHHVEHFHLALRDLAVGLAVDELEVGPAAEDRVAVDRAIAVEPVEVLVEDGLAELLERSASRSAPAGREQCLVDDPAASCRLPCSFRWMPLIVSGSAAFAYSVERRLEQVDEGTPLALATSAIAVGVELEPLVVLDAVGQVAVVQVLVGDRREQDQPRGRLAVVLLGQRVLDERVEVLLELRPGPSLPANDSL